MPCIMKIIKQNIFQLSLLKLNITMNEKVDYSITCRSAEAGAFLMSLALQQTDGSVEIRSVKTNQRHLNESPVQF